LILLQQHKLFIQLQVLLRKKIGTVQDLQCGVFLGALKGWVLSGEQSTCGASDAGEGMPEFDALS
jgi:hypothetical protein